jgi:ribonucleoside-diphosphate reductase alpha chain
MMLTKLITAHQIERERFVALGENHPSQVDKWASIFTEEIATNRFMPGGRILAGAGRPKAQLLNCFVIPTEDSIEGWGRAVSDVIVISGRLGGVGTNLSAVRPRGSYIRGNGGVATGAVSLGKIIDSPGYEIVGGGGRRMALMLCLNITHPDIVEFLHSKTDETALNNANISVVIDIPADEWISKVRNNEDIELKFDGAADKEGNPVGGTVSARELWNQIVENAWLNGEPGVLNGYFANEMNNIAYHKPLISTNPCGEIWLEEYGCCDLGSLVLPRFVKDGKIDWMQLKETIAIGVRFLDNVLDVNTYPLPEIEKNCKEVRRLGLGVMGLHSMLLMLGLKYSSDEAIAFTDLLFQFIKEEAYKASIDLAIEKEPFPAYDEKFLDSGFVKTLPNDIREQIRQHGIRNCALLTIAPTGTTSMVFDMSSGIEPIPAPVYYRNRFVHGEGGTPTRSTDLVVRDEYRLYPNIVEGAADIPVEAHFKMQTVVQKHIDNAVSKTINLPNDYPVEELAELWLDYLPQMKGSTFYRWGTREFEPISPVPKENWNEVIANTNGSTVWGDDNRSVEALLELDCPGGVCSVPDRWEEVAIST